MSVAGAHERVNKISLQQKVKRNGRTSLIKFYAMTMLALHLRLCASTEKCFLKEYSNF